MPRQKGVSQLEVLRRKQAELAEQLKAAEARERERDKQMEARRREIVGAIIVEQLKAEPESPLAKSVMELVTQKLDPSGRSRVVPEPRARAGGRESRNTDAGAAAGSGASAGAGRNGLIGELRGVGDFIDRYRPGSYHYQCDPNRHE